MMAAGLVPIPVHVFGDDEARMNQLFSYSSWVALGGLRRPHRGAAPDTYVKLKMKWAAGRNVHWLGYTEQAMIKGFSPYSVDCASWTAGRTFGQMHVYMGGGDMLNFAEPDWRAGRFRAGLAASKVRAAVARLGIDPKVFDLSESWRNQHYVHRVQMLNARSWIAYSLDVKKHLGTRLFVSVLPDKQDVDAIVAALDWACGPIRQPTIAGLSAVG
jgi:hypothetical protein